MFEFSGLKLAGLAMPVVKLFMRGQKRGRNRPARGNRLGQDSEQRLRRVDALLRAARPIEERIADPVAAAHNGLRKHGVSKPEPRPEILIIRIDQRAIVDAARCRLDQRIGGGVEVGPVVVPFPDRCRELPAETQVNGQFRSHAVVILNV